MAESKRKDVDDRLPEPPTADVFDPFVGGEEDDLSDMEYMQDETTTSVDTHPPETKEEAERLARAEKLGEDDPTPPEGDEPTAEDEPEEEPTAADVDEGDPEALDEGDSPTADDEPEDESLKVPKDRFDEVNERMKKAERELAELREQINQPKEPDAEPEPEPYDYATKEQEAADALLEGDTEKYAAIQAEIRQALRAETLREAENLAAKSGEQTREQLTFEEVGANIEAEFPQFSMQSEEYNAEAREEMLDLFVGYAQSGAYTRAEALQKAADRAVKIYGFNKTETNPEVDDKGDKVVPIDRGGPKTKAAVSKKQPPDMKGKDAGEDEPRHDFARMSDEEFDALPESTKARARGDIL